MVKKIKDVTIRLVQGDITEQEVDAIVNAANSSLLGGGGVDGAIHRAGGPAILDECKEIIREIGALETSGAVATTAGELPAKMVIHTVGPVWKGRGMHGEMVELERAYNACLALATEKGAQTMAFPSISTGAYGFPVDRAAYVAFMTMRRYIVETPEHGLEELRMVLFSNEDFDTYGEVLEEVIDTMIGTPS